MRKAQRTLRQRSVKTRWYMYVLRGVRHSVHIMERNKDYPVTACVWARHKSSRDSTCDTRARKWDTWDNVFLATLLFLYFFLLLIFLSFLRLLWRTHTVGDERRRANRGDFSTLFTYSTVFPRAHRWRRAAFSIVSDVKDADHHGAFGHLISFKNAPIAVRRNNCCSLLLLFFGGF